METIEVLQLLRHWRHDLMNQIQLIQGYTSMNRPEKVKEKLHAMILEANQQRKLMDLQANEFALWLLQANMKNKQIRVTFEVNDVHENLQYLDTKLLEQTKRIFAALEAAADQNELYQVSLNICKPKNTNATVEIQFSISGSGMDTDMIDVQLGYLDIQMNFETHDKIMLTATF